MNSKLHTMPYFSIFQLKWSLESVVLPRTVVCKIPTRQTLKMMGKLQPDFVAIETELENTLSTVS